MASIDLVPGPIAKADRAESVWSRLRHHAITHPLGLVGAVIMAVFVFAAIFADLITTYDPVATNSSIALLIFTGKQAISNPNGGSAARFASFSICQ